MPWAPWNRDKAPQHSPAAAPLGKPPSKKRHSLGGLVRLLKGKGKRLPVTVAAGDNAQEAAAMGEHKVSRIPTLNTSSLKTNGVDKNAPSTTSPKKNVKSKGSCSSSVVSVALDQEKEEDQAKPLQDHDIHILFSGAPQFSVRKWGSRQLPTVSFPWNKGQVHDLHDYPSPAHPAFSPATSRRHVSKVDDTIGTRAGTVGYDIGIEEVPSMLSATGTERGTIGVEHFLEIPISDNYLSHVDDDEATSGLNEATRNIELLHHSPEKLGIRSIESTDVNERLVELSELYHILRAKGPTATILDEHSSGELYAVLFGKFLSPPRFDPHTTDPCGLKVQIETLIKVLQLKGIWFDFSLVEWRIRLGQLIWASAPTHSAMTSAELEDHEHEWTERETLLLQLSLSCELLLRLDAVCDMSTPEVVNRLGLTVEEVRNFSKLKRRKTDWDLLLARRFLDDIHVTLEEDASTSQPASPKKRGFFAAITSDPEPTPLPANSILVFAPRHPTRQLSGLLHFATELLWPNLENISSELSRKLGIPKLGELVDRSKEKPVNPAHHILAKSSPSIYSTPLATPKLTSNRSSYFSISPARPAISRENTALSVQLRPNASPTETIGNPIDIGGWLSRTYLTGFVLPGEALSHLLISTLLENDNSAIAALGDSANLYGAFIYAGSIWWSKSCVAGRVLAAAEGSKECMGWVRSLLLPEASEERWLDISCKDVDVPNRLSGEFAMGSALVKGQDVATVEADEFSLPRDEQSSADDNYPSIKLTGIALETTGQMRRSLDQPSAPSPTSTLRNRPEFTEFGVSLRFTISKTQPPAADTSSTYTTESDINHDLDDRDLLPSETQYTVYITYDVFFVSAHPCIPPPISKVHVILSNAQPPPEKIGEQMPAHPLHRSHRYRTIDAAALLEGISAAFEDEEVLVINCYSRDEEVLARAWSAQRGMHALVARKGRTCLGCAIREAGGCGIAVVIRILEE